MDSRIYQTVGVLVVLAAVAVGCFWQLVTHPRDVLVGPQRGGGNDLTTYFIPSRNYPRQCREQFGQWPFWNPLACAGVPYLGNPQSALFYPANWLCWWFDARDVLSWIMVAHHFWAGLGVYFLCRRLGFAWLSSVLGGCIFLAAPNLMAHTGEGHYAQLCAVAWVPWAFLSYDFMRAGIRPAGVALAVVLALSFFAGHLQETYYLVLLLTLMVVADSIARWRSGDRAGCGRLVLSWLLVSVAAATLVAVDLVPMLVFSRQMVRSSGLGSDVAGKIGVGTLNWFQLINPFAVGGPDSYAGRDKFFWESLLSFGLVPLVLSVVGVVRAWRRHPVRRLTWFVIVAVAFAFGSGSPVFELLFRLIPGLAMFRAPSRVLFFVAMAMAVLAAAGIESLIVRTPAAAPGSLGIWLRRLLLIGVSVGLLLAVAGRHESKRERVPIEEVSNATDSPSATRDAPAVSAEFRAAILQRAIRRTVGSRSTWVLLAFTVFLLLTAERWPKRAAPASVLLLVLIAIELCGHAQRMLTVLPTTALHIKVRIGAIYNYEVEPFRVLSGSNALSDLAAWEHFVQKAQAYEPLPLGRYSKFFAALTGKPDPYSELVGPSSLTVTNYDRELLDLLNVQVAVLADDAPPPDGWQLVARTATQVAFKLGHYRTSWESVAVYTNPNALPRAFVVGRTRVLNQGTDEIQALADLDPRDAALMTVEYLPPGPRAEFAAATIIEYTPNRVVVEATLTAPGYLVLTDQWYPGWTATDNGQPTSVLPANIAFRAVPLSGGTHRVVFAYKPVGLGIAAAISLAAWCGVLCVILWKKPRRTP